MSDEAAPLVPKPPGGLWNRIVGACLKAGLRASLLVSPRPAVLVLRRVFAAGGATVARGLESHTPGDVVGLLDERYGDEPDLLLDVFRPASASGALPTLVWVHGGAWIGGSKEELAGYFKVIAGNGYAVVGPRYSLAPEARYPTPARQLMEALRYLQANAQRLQIDAERIVVGGDSAGAQLAAQVAALVTTPGYAGVAGVTPTIAPTQLRGLVLACGPYDLPLLAEGSATETGRRLVKAVLWAYSGRRRYMDDPVFATMSVSEQVTPAFPPAFVTVGNADPLRPHSELLVERLAASGVEHETLFFPPDHEPPLGHEYQFDLDSDAGRLFLERLLSFLGRRLAERPSPLSDEFQVDRGSTG